MHGLLQTHLLNHRYYITLFILIFFSAFLRFYKLSEYPVGFHIDEATLGYNAYSMLVTGKDEQGNVLPLTIDVFGDGRLTGYDYLTIFPVWLFGLSEFSTRFTGALFGVLTIVAMYLLIRSIGLHRNIALLGSLLISIAPWHINLSRASSESLVTVFFIIFGFALIINGLRISSKLSVLFGSFVSSLSFFIYATPRIFVPLLMGLVVILFYKKNRQRKNLMWINLLSFFYICFLAGFLIFAVKGGTNRFAQVSIFGMQETRLVLEEQIREDGTLFIDPLVVRAFHNKVTNYALAFISNYLDYFNGKFYFIDGGLPLWHKVPSVGIFYLIELPFILIGIYSALRNNNKYVLVIIGWLLIAPIVASLTTDDVPNVKRAIMLFPVIEVFAALGMYTFIVRYTFYSKYVVLIILFLLSVNFTYFLHQYFAHGRTHRALYRNNGFKEMIYKAKDVYNQYDQIIITKSLGGIYPLVLFHMQYNPNSYQKEGSPKDRDYTGFGKFIFAPEFCPSLEVERSYISAKRSMYVNSGACDIPENMIGDKIYREDGTLAFIIEYR